jgi:hypothetical protein
MRVFWLATVSPFCIHISLTRPFSEAAIAFSIFIASIVSTSYYSSSGFPTFTRMSTILPGMGPIIFSFIRNELPYFCLPKQSHTCAGYPVNANPQNVNIRFGTISYIGLTTILDGDPSAPKILSGNASISTLRPTISSIGARFSAITTPLSKKRL